MCRFIVSTSLAACAPTVSGIAVKCGEGVRAEEGARMNVRQGMLVRELLAATGFRTSEQYADDLGCSDRTVRSDVAAVDAYLESAGFKARVISKPGSGIWLAPTPAERGRLQRLLDESEVSMRPKLERLSQELVILACEPGPHSVDTLARRLYVGKRLVQADVRTWQRALAPHGIELEAGRHLSLKGSERDIRMFVLLFLASFPPRAIERRVEPLLTGGSMHDEPFYGQVVDGAQEALGAQFSSNGRRHMMIYAKIMVARLGGGMRLEGYEGNRPLVGYVASLEKRFRRRFGLETGPSELAFVQDLYDCCTWQWSAALFEREPVGRVAALTAETEHALEAAFGLPVPASCHHTLAVTIERGLVRRACGIASPNPNEHMVKYDLMDGFCLLTSVLGRLDRLAGARLYGSDYARVALVLMEYAQKAGRERRYRAGLVVNCGIDLVLFGKRCIEERVPAVSIVDILTEDEARSAARDPGALAERFDLLISFEPLDVAFPSVVISSRVNEEDLSRIAASLPLRGGDGDLPWREHEVPPEALGDVRDGRLVRRLVLEGLAAAGAVPAVTARLEGLFETIASMRGRTLVVPLCDADVEVTGVHLFRLMGDASVFGQRCEAVAALCVRAEERGDLMPLVERFKQALDENAPTSPEEEDALYVERE